MNVNQTQPVVFLMGPTASGKTRFAIDLVQRIPADIISVDSAMIYIGMDIGTAKPDAKELAIAPHALIDIIDPAESWSAGEFCISAKKLIADSHHRGRIPVLVGGTMMYFRALEHGIADLPQANEQIRRSLNEQAKRVGWPAMHEWLNKVDDVTAARVHPNDSQRIQRALEVYLISGKTLTDLKKNTSHRLEHSLVKCALSGHPREILRQRIAHRFEQMMEHGLLEEVRDLYLRGDLHADLPSIRSVGYRQIWHYLEGECSLKDAVSAAITATRQLAKRQYTWMRGDSDLHHLSADRENNDENIDGLLRLLRY